MLDHSLCVLALFWDTRTNENNKFTVFFNFRRMFPVLQFSLRGLDPERQYNVFVDMQLANCHHWKFQNGKWTESGQAEQQPPSMFSLILRSFERANWFLHFCEFRSRKRGPQSIAHTFKPLCGTDLIIYIFCPYLFRRPSLRSSRFTKFWRTLDEKWRRLQQIKTDQQQKLRCWIREFAYLSDFRVRVSPRFPHTCIPTFVTMGDTSSVYPHTNQNVDIFLICKKPPLCFAFSWSWFHSCQLELWHKLVWSARPKLTKKYLSFEVEL